MANFITIMRLILSVFLIIYEPQYSVFIIIYSLCGISDILDGFIARRTKSVSIIGSRLDSIADFVFGIVIFKLIFNTIYKNMLIIIMIIIIFCFRMISMLIMLKKYKQIGFIHTYLNKVTGLFVFIYGYFKEIELFAYFICFIAFFAVIEELYININSKKLNLNEKYWKD